MAPYKEPKSLFNLAAQSLGNYIGSVAVSLLKNFHGQTENNAEESKNLQIFIKETTEHYDTHIPQCLHNIVTFYSLIHFVSHIETNLLYFFDITTTKILDIVIRAHITKLNFSEWPYSVRKYLCKSLQRIKKLKFLDFSEERLFFQQSEYIFTGIQGMENLQSVVCPYFSDTILEVLSNKCTLKNLDIRSSYSAGDSSVLSLLKMQSLKTLEISNGFSVNDCKRIILGLPNLIYISYKRLNQVLAQITENVVLPLQYVEYDCYSQKDVTSLINLCPNIKKLYVSDYSRAIDFSDLVALQNLTSLAVDHCNGFYKGGIKFILETQGYQITELEFADVHEISMKTLYEISTLCPKLNILVLDHLLVYEQPALPTENKILFPKLEYLYCGISVFSNLNSLLLLLLHNCINIKIVKFANFGVMSDKDILDVFSYNHLECLEKLLFLSDYLTVKSIFVLISSCKKLKQLGYLNTWFKITESEIQELQQYIKETNLDVKLIKWPDGDKEQNSVMKSPRHEFTIKTKFCQFEREFFVVEEDP